MKIAIKKNKQVLRFLLIFTASYAILYFFYFLLIKNSNEIDFFTKIVSNQTVKSLNFIGYETYTKIDPTNNFVRLFVRNKNIASIIEGCNAVSVMILFAAFIFSFFKDLKSTIIYSLAGVFIIHVMNILRIIIIIICMYHFPDYSMLLHEYVFPITIYGVVFLLWMFWVKSFQTKKQ